MRLACSNCHGTRTLDTQELREIIEELSAQPPSREKDS